MPFKLSRKGNGFVVIDDKGKEFSKKPLPRERALAQMRALYANVPDARGKGGGQSRVKEFYGGSLMVFKDKQGDYRWILFSSNAYQDQDKEIVSTKALSDDVERTEKENPGHYGPLRWWHVPGADLGECDLRTTSNSGRTLIESGTFKSAAIGRRIEKAAKELQVSIGFNHPKDEPDRDGVYHHVYTFERSLLPAGKAANAFTRVMVKGVEPMATKEEKLKALKALGIDPEAILAEADATEKELEGDGISYKEQGEEPADPLDEALNRAEALVEEIKAKKKKAPPHPEPEQPGEEEPEEPGEDEETEYLEEGEDAEPVMGNMTMPEFKAVMKEVMGEAMAPITKMLEAAEKARTKKEEKEKDGAMTALMAQLKELEDAIQDLSGDVPVAARGYRASQSKDTEIDPETMKELGVPQPDPFAQSFITDFLGLDK